MPESWKEFEEKCFNYLQSTYKNVKFNLIGGSNSKISDIKVIDKDFFIEIKSPRSQCGQFVVLPNGDQFKYSERNIITENEYSNFIINYMNDNFSTFYDVIKKRYGSVNIYVDNYILVNWIINFYKTKKVKYFITKKEDNYIIFPLEKINNYFNIKAVYRKKTSGSSCLPCIDVPAIRIFFENMKIKFKLEELGSNKQWIIITEHALKDKKIVINKVRYQFKKYKDNIYIIRKLSNTNNHNVIFSINLIKNYQEEEDLISFLEDIQS